jgi:site-specific DNA-methyltransferase (adenine-specific)
MQVRGSRIVQGNCVEVMAQWPSESVNFILTDPPYLVGYMDRSGRSIAGDKKDDWLKPAFAEMFRLLERDSFCVSFYGWNAVDRFFDAWKSAGFNIVGHLVFPKRYTSRTGFLRAQHECAYLLMKGRPAHPDWPIGDVLEWMYTGNKLHPTQKPVGSLIPIIESFSRKGGVVLDPFAGSGSTCAAAKLLGRRYLGVELDAAHQATASERMDGYSQVIRPEMVVQQ